MSSMPCLDPLKLCCLTWLHELHAPPPQVWAACPGHYPWSQPFLLHLMGLMGLNTPCPAKTSMRVAHLAP